MADCLMITQNDGTAKPVGVIQGDASDIKYDENTSVEEAIDTKISGKKISSNITNLSISSSIGNLYYADVQVDISSLELSQAPTEILVSYVPDSSIQNIASPISVVVVLTAPTEVTVRFIRPDNNKTTTGKLTLFICG